MIERLATFSPHALRFRARRLAEDAAAAASEVELRILPEGAPTECRATFLLELEDLLNLEHAAFPAVLDHGQTGEQPFYLVPLHEGQNLWRQLKAVDAPTEERCLMLRSLAAAFAHAGRRGILLGPPSPLILAWDPATACLRYIHHRVPREVRALPYPAEAPQTEIPSETWSERSDVLHWAYFAYWLVSHGKLPFHGPGAAVPVRSLEPMLERELAHVIDGCLMRRPELRPEGMIEVQAVLDGIAANVRTEGPPAMEHSGSLPHEAMMDSIRRLETEGRLAESRKPTQRKTLAMDLGNMEISGLETLSRRRTKVGVGAAAVGLLLLVGLGFSRGGDAPQVPSRPPTPPTRPASPPPEASPRPRADAPLAPGELGRLAGVRSVDPKAFSTLWGKLKKLADAGQLPEELSPQERLTRLQASFWKDRSQGCQDMEAFLEEMRVALRRRTGS